jgi:hypothetical protein
MFSENIYKVTKDDLDDIRLTNNLPLKYYDLYSSFKIEKDEYDEKLQNVLLLYQPRKLKLFFRNVNDILKYYYNEFKTAINLNSYVINKITSEIFEFIKLNLSNAKQYVLTEKPYEFGKIERLIDTDI